MKAGSYVSWWTDNAPHVGVITSTTKRTAMVRYGSGDKRQQRRFPLEQLCKYEGHAKGRP